MSTAAPPKRRCPKGVVFVGSDDSQAGTLEMEELARLMNHRGNVAIMVGELASNGAQLRTKAVEDVVAKYPGMKIVEKQVGNFQRERGLDLMNNWLTAGTKIDAVAANNDEMAIGAIMAIQQAGIPPGKILVGGVDATPDALAEMAKGTLAVTVFQDARGQARGAVDAAVKLVARRNDRQLRLDSVRAGDAGQLQELPQSVAVLEPVALKLPERDRNLTSSVLEPAVIDRILPHLVIDDALGRVEQPRRLGAVAARGFERVRDQILLVGRDGVASARRA